MIARDGAHGLHMKAVARGGRRLEGARPLLLRDPAGAAPAAIGHADARTRERVDAELEGLPTGSGAARADAGRLRRQRARSASSQALWNEVWSSVGFDEELRPLVRAWYDAGWRGSPALVEEGCADGSIPARSTPGRRRWRLGALADGRRLLLYSGVVGSDEAVRLLRSALDEVAGRMSGAGGVALDAVTKSYGEQVAVDDVTLEVGAGEFLLPAPGPSGCGKTTSLRMIAGFLRPDVGRILLGGDDVTETPPHRRPVNTVFQSYALFPHLTVEDNVAFGLRFHRVTKDEKRAGCARCSSSSS